MAYNRKKTEGVIQIVLGFLCIITSVLYTLSYFKFYNKITYSLDPKKLSVGLRFHAGLIKLSSCTLPISEKTTSEIKDVMSGKSTTGNPEVQNQFFIKDFSKCNELTDEEIERYRVSGDGKELGIDKDDSRSNKQIQEKIKKSLSIHPPLYSEPILLDFCNFGLLFLVNAVLIPSGVMLVYKGFEDLE